MLSLIKFIDYDFLKGVYILMIGRIIKEHSYCEKIFFIFFIIVLLNSCNFLLGISSIKYEVTGTASSVDLTIENKGGGTSQFSNVSLPWKYEFTKQKNDEYDFVFLYVSAQNNGSFGTVTSTIYVDGDSWKSSTSSGSYVVATASGSL